MAAYFIFKVLGLQPEKDIFPKDKETLVRYYACSLAICTHGCDWLDQDGHRICLDNDTFTHECNLQCEDVCREFGNCGDTDDTIRCCGPTYNLSVSLGGKVLLKCYVPRMWLPVIGYLTGGQAGSDIYNFEYIDSDGARGFETFYNKLVKNEGLPQIIKTPKVVGETILGQDCIKNVNHCGGPCSIYDLKNFYPGQMRTEKGDKIVGSQDPLGVPADYWLENGAGIGQIFLDDTEAYEKYGCSGDCNVYSSPTRFGFDQCLFRGEINIWSDWKNNDCADVRFNSTISGDWGFTIECTAPIDPPPDWCKQKIILGETADYTIRITNNLGTGAKFKLGLSYTPEGTNPNCKFWKDAPDEDIHEIFVNNYGETEQFHMSCKPNKAGTYKISVSATAGAKGGKTEVELVTSDFTWTVEPGEDGKDKPIGRGLDRSYTIMIQNKIGEATDFQLEVNTETISGIDVDKLCTFDANDDVTYTLENIPDDGSDFTRITCNRDHDTNVHGEYEITIRASGGGVTKDPKIRHLTILECSGDIKIEFVQAGHSTDTVTSGEDFYVEATGLSGCQNNEVNISVVYPDLVITHCGASGWDGNVCGDEQTKNASTPGNYTVYAFIDKDKDGKTDGEGESDTATLTINAPSMDDSTCDTNGGCSFSMDEWWCWNGILSSSTHICDYCVCHATWPWGGCGWWRADNCGIVGADGSITYDLDPQSDRCFSPSNLCCKSDSNEYSNGPGISCLSPDTNTYNDRTINWWYGGVDNSRNVLVKDYTYATFKYRECSNNEDCRGGSGAPNSLSSATCNIITKRCKLSDSLPTYTSWLYIRISETSRPIYGLVLRGLNDNICGEFLVFLHNESKGWFNIGGGDLNQWKWFYPSGKWSWDGIDSLLIVQADDCSWVNPPGYKPYFSLDYIGLLTKDGPPLRTPFCTEGNENDYYRIVDDGKTCYWNLNCPTSGGGWTTDKPASTGVGAFGECDCLSGTCGEGYCEKEYGGNKFCYYNVQCANGGWRNPKDGEPNLGIKRGGC